MHSQWQSVKDYSSKHIKNTDTQQSIFAYLSICIFLET